MAVARDPSRHATAILDTPIDRSTMVDRLTTSLIDSVILGRFPVGEPLPPERDLAAALDVNRATLRQAVGRLEQIGLVTRRQGSGTIVQDPELLTAPEVVGRIASDERTAFVADLLEVREALAGVIGRRAAGTLTDRQRLQLYQFVDAIEAADTARQRQVLELGFFAILVQAAGNRAIHVLLQWVERVYENLDLPSIESAFEDGPVLTHRLRTLLGRIEQGDAAAAMTEYAHETGQAILDAAAR